MTLMVNISVAPGQSFRAKIEVIDKYPDKEPVVAQVIELKPGECAQPYLTNCRELRISELPLSP